MSLVYLVLYFLLLVVIIVGGVILLKKYVFDKIRINKFIPLGISILMLIYQMFFRVDNKIIGTVVTLLIVFFFAWFWDIQQTGGVKKEKKIVIKPKAKPNRVKKK